MGSKKTVLLLVCNFIIFGIAFSYAQTVYVIDEFEVTMRTGPSIENKIIVMLPTGTKLQVIEEKGDWVLVRSPIGREGWVLKRYVSVVYLCIIGVHIFGHKCNRLSSCGGEPTDVYRSADCLISAGFVQQIEHQTVSVITEGCDRPNVQL